ncbi:CoA-disulfide reductase [uncultured delta proteobacterium]|uniref:CoA-disulfide reductase n=1 Tax=uncultured delta proteobacterium TaxID=34034 RepID=A0A212JUH7_9DELT|nr:CoA-disulfide reductase [uncultured delta proteobacterium]
MSLHVVVVGGVALGPKAACRFMRLMPEGTVTLIDQTDRISYGGCGIPFFVSGEVSRVEDLRSTPYGVVRDKDFFFRYKGVNVLTRSKVIGIDRDRKRVRMQDLDTIEVREIAYDRLVLATGSRAKMPPIPGIDLLGVTAAATLDDAERIKTAVAQGKVNAAVVVGGGFIGLEMAVALADLWGLPVSVVEFAEHILPSNVSPLLATMATQDLKKSGVDVFCSEKVLRLEGENGQVKRVVTDKRTIEADLVIMSVGVSPETALAKEAGLEMTENGLILVDEHMRTSDPSIYSGGDCAAVANLVTGEPGWFALGSQANRQGRVIGTNLAGGDATFPGAVGAWGVKLFSQSVSGAGLTLAQAKKAGFDAMSVHVEQVDRAHFYPDHAMMALELIVDRPTRRVLGIQGMAESGDALVGRINAVVPYLGAKGTVADISNLEVVYSPPFASAMDVLNVVGNVAENALEGRSRTMDVDEFALLWDKRASGDACFLDVRDPVSAETLALAYPGEWKNVPQDMLRDRLNELPADTPLVLVCNTGLRAFEAQRVLDSLGRKDTRAVAGGLVAVGRAGHAMTK